LLCGEPDGKVDYASPPYVPGSPTPPPSPDYRRPYAPLRADSICSNCSSTSSLATVSSQGLYSPKTPPILCLPPLEKLLPVPGVVVFSARYGSDAGSPVLASATMGGAASVDGSLSPTSTHASTVSTPPSPKTAVATPAAKRSSRRYTCHCGKSFTTSGHLARHTRIHTGEKNYVCPEAGCAARFSRQDNCMQHYRTHQSGSGSKRAARKRRMSTEAVSSQRRMSTDTVSLQRTNEHAARGTSPASQPPVGAPADAPVPMHFEPPLQATHHHRHIPPPCDYANYFEPFGSDDGLTALANVACAGYP